MDQIFAAVLDGLFVYLGLALVLAVLLGVLRSPRFKGWQGERAVRSTIRQHLNPLVYVDVHNVTLPTRDGSTQMDHLIFSPYGVFVLETKNYQGWIFGSETQPSWTQQIYKKRSKFQNPLRQNYKHTKVLQKLLKIDAEHVHSVIAFVGDCEFKTEMPLQVTKGDGFVRYIQSFTQTVWQPEEMQALLDQLEAVRLQPGRATNKQHVAHVKELQAAKAVRKSRPQSAVLEPAKTPAPATVDIPLDLPRPAEKAAAPALAASSAPPAPPLTNPAPVPAPVAKPLSATAFTQNVKEVPVCPQCEWPLRTLLMQRGPMAGQAVWRCTNGAACSFVRAAE